MQSETEAISTKHTEFERFCTLKNIQNQKPVSRRNPLKTAGFYFLNTRYQKRRRSKAHNVCLIFCLFDVCSGPHKDGPLYDPRVAILSLGEKATLEFWETFEDAEADCAASATAAADAELLEEPDQGRSNNSTNQGGKGAGKNNTVVSKDRKSLVSVECEHCSLVVFEGRAYRDFWHGIAATSSLRGDGEDDYDAEKIKRMGSHGKKKKKKRLSFTVRRVVRVVGADTVLEHPEARSEMERKRRAFERSVAETTAKGKGKGGVAGTFPPRV